MFEAMLQTETDVEPAVGMGIRGGRQLDRFSLACGRAWFIEGRAEPVRVKVGWTSGISPCESSYLPGESSIGRRREKHECT